MSEIPLRTSPGRPPLYPWRDVSVGESFTIPSPETGGPTLASVRNMACQYRRKYGLRFRVHGPSTARVWTVTRIAA